MAKKNEEIQVEATEATSEATEVKVEETKTEEVKSKKESKTDIQIVGLTLQQARRKFHKTEYKIEVAQLNGEEKSIVVSNGTKLVKVVVEGGKIVSAIV